MTVNLNGGFIRSIAEDGDNLAIVTSLECSIISSSELRVVKHNNILLNSGAINFEVSSSLMFNNLAIIAKGNAVYTYSVNKNEIISALVLESTTMITSLCKSCASNTILLTCIPNLVIAVDISQSAKLAIKSKYEVKHIDEIYGIRESGLPGLYFLSGNIHEEKKTLSTLCYYVESGPTLSKGCIPREETLMLLRDNAISFKKVCEGLNCLEILEPFHPNSPVHSELATMKALYYLMCMCKYDDTIKSELKSRIVNKIIMGKMLTKVLKSPKYKALLGIYNANGVTERIESAKNEIIFDYRVCPICYSKLVKSYYYDTSLFGTQLNFPTDKRTVTCANGHCLIVKDMSFKLWDFIDGKYKQCSVCLSIVAANKVCKICDNDIN